MQRMLQSDEGLPCRDEHDCNTVFKRSNCTAENVSCLVCVSCPVCHTAHASACCTRPQQLLTADALLQVAPGK